MARQLSLLEDRPEWQLDETTREVGLRGIAAARAALAAAVSAHEKSSGTPASEHPSHDRSAA